MTPVSPVYSQGISLRLRSPSFYSASISGATNIAITPGAGQRVVISFISYSNYSGYDCRSIGLSWGSTGTIYQRCYVPASGGGYIFNLIGNEMDAGPSANDTILYIRMDVTDSPTVYVTLGYYLV